MATMLDQPLYGAVEGGGTKFICAVGHGPDAIVHRTRIETTTPDETLERVASFIARASGSRPLASVGIACFGPLELDPTRPEFGSMLATPKPGWTGAPITAPLASRLGVPVVLETDVNGAALAEWRWGAAQRCDPALYLTVGTGIGGGAIVHGRPLHGLLHPEMGHIPVPRLTWPDGTLDTYPGFCPFHGACLEGLIAGPALGDRLGMPAASIEPAHPVWELVAGYIANALASYTLILSPQRIVLGGGVAQQPRLLDRVRHRFVQALAGYVPRPEVRDPTGYLTQPHFGQDAGLAGAFALAQHPQLSEHS